MCEMMGSEPLEDEIPIERDDLSIETQLVFAVYDKLPARWEGFSGQYLGKDLVVLPVLFEEYDFDSGLRKYAWDIIPIIDGFVAADVAEKVKQKTKVPKGDIGGRN